MIYFKIRHRVKNNYWKFCAGWGVGHSYKSLKQAIEAYNCLGNYDYLPNHFDDLQLIMYKDIEGEIKTTILCSGARCDWSKSRLKVVLDAAKAVNSFQSVLAAISPEK